MVPGKSKRSCANQLEHLELRRLLSTVYVSAAAPGVSPDGASWATAFTDLQQALAVANVGDTIEVGQGTYYPTAGTDRTATFELQNGISIEGGFAGYGATNPDQHNAALYPTTLSGDIGAAGDSSDNSYHVVTVSGFDYSETL
ncbi:MAG TPA: hypothetical protein VG722_08430, partial [Tepidisphaeraceae bacterium]|nr:hypothetical protein [Tepidisphaeraceae bacterium]